MRSVLCVVALSSFAFAQTPIGPFTGQSSEEFVPPQAIFVPCMPYRVFNNTADMCTPSGGGCHTTTGWSNQCTIYAYSGSHFFGSVNGPVEIAFDTAITKFGGWFGNNSNSPDGTVWFYDAAGVQIGTATVVDASDCAWHWNGWSLSTPAKKVRLASSNGTGTYLMMDSLQVDHSVAPPVVYCTAGTTTNGCLASISATSNPNVAHSNTCQIAIANVEGQKSGIIFYALTQLVQPWCTTSSGSSFLCVKPPTMRTGVQSSGGTSTLCNGAMALDWNAFQLANPSALGAPWSAGQKSYVQGWFRDPASCKTTSLSDALELTYQP
jgi:hypothetical protein